MPNDFVILTRARSGSNSLMSRLDSCPDVVCHGEIFKPRRIDMRRDYRPRLPVDEVGARNADPVGFIAGIRGLDPDKHVGFKIFPHQLAAVPAAIEHIAAPATLRIVLTRAPLEVYASGLRMRATGVHKRKEDTPAAVLTAPVRFTPKSFRRFAAVHNRFMTMARLIAAAPGSFVIDYAQINDPAALDALFGFVGSRARAADSRTAYSKQYAGRLEDGIANWGELQDFLRRAAPPLLAAPPPSCPG